MVSHLSSPHGLVRFKYSLIIIALLNWFCVSNFLSQRKKKIWRAEELPAWSTTCKDELQQTKTCQSQWDNILKKKELYLRAMQKARGMLREVYGCAQLPLSISPHPFIHLRQVNFIIHSRFVEKHVELEHLQGAGSVWYGHCYLSSPG